MDAPEPAGELAPARDPDMHFSLVARIKTAGRGCSRPLDPLGRLALSEHSHTTLFGRPRRWML